MWNVVSAWKIEWLKNTSKEGGAQAEVIKRLNEGEVPICSHTNKLGRMWTGVSIDMIKTLSKKDRGLFEIITPYVKRKVYFDIDVCINEEKQAFGGLQEIKSVILKQFPEAKMHISGSETDYKISYHICLSNYYFNNTDEQKVLKLFATQYKHLGFDENVYTNNRLMKCVNQSKASDKRVQLPISGNNHLILCEFDNDSINANDIMWNTCIAKALKDNTKSNALDLLTIEERNMEVPDQFNWDDVSSLGILNTIPNVKRGEEGELSRNVSWLVMLWAKGCNISFEDFAVWLWQKDASSQRIKRYFVAWEQSGNKYPDMDFIKRLLLRFYPKITEDRFGKLFRKACQTEANVICEGKYVTKEHIQKALESASIVYATNPMGMGKTQGVIDWLKEQNGTCLWFSPRCSYAENVCQRLEAEGVPFKNYRYFRKDDADRLNEAKRLVISPESLHKTDMDKVYKTVILDEVESIKNIWGSDHFEHNLNLSWIRFKQIIKSADQVILMDAFPNNTTLQWFKDIRDTHDSSVIATNETPIKRSMLKYGKFENWKCALISELIKGKNVYVFYPFIKSTEKHQGQDGLRELLCIQTGIPLNEILLYNGSIGDFEKKQLSNVNETWSKARCVISNTAITVGVNFDTEHFDTIFAYYNSYMVSPRDFFQNMYRSRHITENSIHLFHTPFKRNDGFSMSPFAPNCEPYKRLMDIVKQEYFARDILTFKYFANASGFYFEGKPIETSKQLHNQVCEAEKNIHSCFAYDNITDCVDEYELEEKYMPRIWNYEASLEDKLVVSKFYFKNKFVTDTPEAIMRTLWDNNTINFTEQVAKLGSNRRHILWTLFDQNECNETLELHENPKWNIDINELTRIFKIRKHGEAISTNNIRDCLKAYFRMDCYKPQTDEYEDDKGNMKQKQKLVRDGNERYYEYEHTDEYKARMQVLLKYLCVFNEETLTECAFEDEETNASHPDDDFL